MDVNIIPSLNPISVTAAGMFFWVNEVHQGTACKGGRKVESPCGAGASGRRIF